MQKNMFRKGIAIAIIVLFVGASVVPSTGMVEISNNGRAILYVGGSGPGNYSKIQDAIDNASDGDTVYVYNGTYYENVVVDVSINLTGEDRDTTIIDGGGSGNIVDISTVEWVKFSNFTLKNGGNGIRLFQSNNTTIIFNLLIDNSYGIYAEESNGNLVSNNNFMNNSIGIYFYYNDDYNTIEKNSLFNLAKDIKFELNSNGNIINNNTCHSISLDSSDNNVISHNNCTVISLDDCYECTVSDNNCNSMFFDGTSNTLISNNICCNGSGIYHWWCSGNILINNTVNGHNTDGIDLEEGYDNILRFNTFNGNNGDGIHLADYSSNNIIENNICNNNTGSGISECNLCKNSMERGYDNFIRNNTCNDNQNGMIISYSGSSEISNNTCYFNSYCGFYLEDAVSNIIKENNIGFNDYYGMYLDSYSNQNNIYHNNLINNTLNAYDEGNNYWDNDFPSGGNYWDDYNGIDADGDGIGDTPYNISGGDNQDLYPLMYPFEMYYILDIILEDSEVDEGIIFNVTVKSKADIPIPNATVEFNDELKLTDSDGRAYFTAPQVGEDTYYEIIANKEGYTGDTETILIKDVPFEFVSTFIFGRIDNLTTGGDVITFEAVNIRCVTFLPFTYNGYTSGELITISKNPKGFVGALFGVQLIFALCDASI